METPELDRLLSDDYVAGLADLPLDEVRSRRTQCQEVEVGLSYVRRLLQGRLEIVLAEQQHRSSGDGRGDLSALVEQLKHGEILGDKLRGAGPGRLPTYMAPAEASGELTEELEAIAGASSVASLPDLDDDEVRAMGDRLQELEHTVSGQRRSLHERIDLFHEEIVRRYQTGEANVDTLLQ